MLALSQLNEEGALRESKAIGQDADGVWVLELVKPKRGDKDEEPESRDCCAVNLMVKKQRNGPAPETVRLTFLKSYTRFESAAKVSADDVPMDV